MPILLHLGNDYLTVQDRTRLSAKAFSEQEPTYWSASSMNFSAFIAAISTVGGLFSTTSTHIVTDAAKLSSENLTTMATSISDVSLVLLLDSKSTPPLTRACTKHGWLKHTDNIPTTQTAAITRANKRARYHYPNLTASEVSAVVARTGQDVYALEAVLTSVHLIKDSTKQSIDDSMLDQLCTITTSKWQQLDGFSAAKAILRQEEDPSRYLAIKLNQSTTNNLTTLVTAMERSRSDLNPTIAALTAILSMVED